MHKYCQNQSTVCAEHLDRMELGKRRKEVLLGLAFDSDRKKRKMFNRCMTELYPFAQNVCIKHACVICGKASIEETMMTENDVDVELWSLYVEHFKRDAILFNDGCVRICTQCVKSMEANRVCTYSSLNGFVLEVIPMELCGLSSFERRMISLYIPSMCFMSTFGGQLRLTGHCMLRKGDTVLSQVVSRLPRKVHECGVVIVNFEKEVMRNLVRPVKLFKALTWLRDNNPLYGDIEIDQEYLHSILNEFDQISREFVTTQTEVDGVFQIEVCAGVIEYASHDPVQVNLERLIAKYPELRESEVRIGSSDDQEVNSHLVQDFLEDDVFYRTFPYLFVKGSVWTPQRKVSLVDMRHLLQFYDRRFMVPDFIFYCMNYLQRKRAMGACIAMKKNSSYVDLSTFCTDVTDIAHMTLDNLKSHISRISPFYASERGTSAYFKREKRTLISLIQNTQLIYGKSPTWFLTLSAEDRYWPEFFNALNVNECEVLDSKQRVALLNEYPDVAAGIFERKLTEMLVFLEKSEVIGKVSKYWYRIEFQMRGSPHAHILIWDFDAPQILDYDQVEDYKDASLSYVQGKMTADLPDVKECDSDFHPSSFLYSSGWSDVEKLEDLHRIVNLCQRHKCLTMYCRKNNPNICRFGFPKRKQDCASWKKVPKKGWIIQPTQNDEWLNVYNPDILRIWRSNMDLQYVTNPWSAAQYIGAYISKKEPELNRLRKCWAKAVSRKTNVDVHQSVQSMLQALVSSRETSLQESIWYMLSKQYVNSSFEFSNVSLLRRPEDLHSINLSASGRKSLKAKEILRYIRRPVEECHMSLMKWLLHLNKRKKSWVPVWKGMPNFDEEDEEYCLCILQILHPWRVTEDLLLGCLDFKTAYGKWKNEIAGSYEKSFLTQKQKFHDAFADLHSVLDCEEERDYPNSEVGNDDEEKSEGHRDCIQEQETVTRGSVIPSDVTIVSKERFKEIVLFAESLKETLVLQQEQDSLACDQTGDVRQIYADCTEEQMRVVEVFKSHWEATVNTRVEHNLVAVLTGVAGAGKSFVASILKKLCYRTFTRSSCGRYGSVLTCAFTGQAASLLGGFTIHSAFSIGQKDLSVSTQSSLETSFRYVRFIIIDEVSMVSARLLEQIDRRLREVVPEKRHLSFGGKDVLFMGDFCQLPPVRQPTLFRIHECETVDGATQTGRMLWSSIRVGWYLKTSLRQQESDLLTPLLNRLRCGEVTESDVFLLESKRIRGIRLKTLSLEMTCLFAKNKDMNAHNAFCLQSLSGNIISIYPSYMKADGVISRNWLDRCLSHRNSITETRPRELYQTKLEIKIGSVVMLTTNICPQRGLYNGSIGIVRNVVYEEGGTICSDYDSWYANGLKSSLPVVFVEFHRCSGPFLEGVERPVIPVRPIKQRLSCNGLSGTTFTYIPLRLAYGLTIHKSQGMTLDRVMISTDGICDTYGMAYVAFSRVKSIEGIYITGSTLLQARNLNKQAHTATGESVREEMERISNLSMSCIPVS
jgi:hypothetical protein